MDLASSRIDVLPNQDGLNLNPQWAPDGKSVAFISDRTGIANVFLFDFQDRQHYQLTNVVGTIGAISEYSPAITWARLADRLAFTYYESGDHTVWAVDNPRRLKKAPFVPQPATPTVASSGTPMRPAQIDSSVRAGQTERTENMLAAIEAGARAADTTRDTSGRTVSLYRSTTGIRPSADAPTTAERSGNAPVTVAEMLDSAAMALPDTGKFRQYDYSVSYQPEAIYRPSIGYAQDNFGRGLYGGAGIVLSDLLGNNRVIVAGQVNGRLSEAYFLSAFTNLASRFQYTLGVQQVPIFFLTDFAESDAGTGNPNHVVQTYRLARYIQREGFAIGMRPSNRFTRWETGISATNISRDIAVIRRLVDYSQGEASGFFTDSVEKLPGFNYVAPYLAYVSDNTLFGYTGPISGRRMRFQVQPAFGSVQWTEYSADYRKYVPLLFNFLTIAWRAQTSIGIGSGDSVFKKYIGRADFIRGYDREQFAYNCGGLPGQTAGCSATELLGSRVALANVEVRFPLVRRFDLGLVPISLPPLDGLVFYDAGIAWDRGQTPYLKKPDNYDQDLQRFVLKSYGFGLRLNLFGFALLRWDYAIPIDRPSIDGKRRGYWQFSLGPSF
jgi:hypothetical protein